VARAARQRLILRRVLPAAEARHGMVVAEERRAAEIGREILRAGGNAIDAAVAVGYGLAVVDPCCITTVLAPPRC
jgi:gamma-glutamyltranspeptidase